MCMDSRLILICNNGTILLIMLVLKGEIGLKEKTAIAFIAVVGLVYLYLVLHPQISTGENLQPKQAEGNIHLEMWDGNVIFDFVEPETPPLYVLSVKPEPDLYDTMKDSLFNRYKKLYPAYLKTVSYSETATQMEYRSEFGHFTFDKEYNDIFFMLAGEKVFDPENADQVSGSSQVNDGVEEAKNFIEQYGGGFRNDLVLDGAGPDAIFFTQQIDGVLLPFAGISVHFYHGEIIGIRRCTYNITKKKQIAEIDILSPLQALQKARPKIETYFNNSTSKYTVKYTAIRLEYMMLEDNLVIPIWVVPKSDDGGPVWKENDR